ncbi:MAG: hypothetical protein A2Y25_03550 [Candidatus Melainabacteria bacterium GWF2_37_15]|nr:MAG: hypothetical protein A2Y25_03550 [Candidatus Melainabacteria bacterium GWF2_37_15]
MSAFFLVKILTSAVVIAIVTEIAKKYTMLGGLIAAMPITTLLSMFWLYYEKKDLVLIQNFLTSVVGGTILSFVFFIVAIYLFKKGVSFYATVFVSLAVLGVGVEIYRRFLG